MAGCIAVNKKLGLNDFLKIPVSDELENNTNASVALVIIGTIVAAIVEILFIVIRFAASKVSFNKILMLLVRTIVRFRSCICRAVGMFRQRDFSVGN